MCGEEVQVVFGVVRSQVSAGVSVRGFPAEILGGESMNSSGGEDAGVRSTTEEGVGEDGDAREGENVLVQNTNFHLFLSFTFARAMIEDST